MNLIKRLQLLGFFAIVLMASSVFGQVIPVDDFDDMIFDGWTELDFSDGQDWGPGSYDVSNQDLRIFHSGSDPVPPGTPITQRALFASWDESDDNPLFSTGFLRAQMRTNSENNSSSIIMRADFSTFSAYVLFGNTTPGGNAFALSKFVGGAEFRLWDSGIAYQPGEDWNVELGVVDNEVSAKVWRVNETEPDQPQYADIDQDVLSAGNIGLSSDVVTIDTPDFADATFDNIVFFAVPEPASFAVALAGILGLLALRR